MTPAPTPAGAVRLRGEMGRELRALERAARRVEEARGRSAAAGAAWIEHTALGKSLDDVYQAAERIFRSIAKAFEGVPEGGGWHTELLANMAAGMPAERPAVLSPATVPPLRELLGFRHTFRNLYSDDLDPARLDTLAASVPALATALRADLSAFDLFLEKLAAGASE